MFKVNIKNTKKTSFCCFISNKQQISHLFPVFLLLMLSKYLFAGIQLPSERSVLIVQVTHRFQVFYKISVLKKFAKFTEKYLRWSTSVIQFQSYSLLKKKLWHRYFPENFAKLSRTAFFAKHLWWITAAACLIALHKN